MKILKSKALIITMLLFTIYGSAQNLVTLPKRSPRATFSQTFGITTATINYGAPKVKVFRADRTGKIWGQLIPFGLQKINFAGKGEIPWRAGADENTTITFNTDVKVEGKALAAGTYGLHMIINDKENVTIIFSKDINSWGSFWYNSANDALRVDVKMREVGFHNVLNYSCTALDTVAMELSLTWENKQIPFMITADTQSLVVENLKNEMKGQFGFAADGQMQAAQYLARVNKDLDLALQWTEASLTQKKVFRNLSLKANILYKQGKVQQALSVLDEAAVVANFRELNQIGYLLKDNKHLDKAIKFFELNVKRNPKNANGYNSLGEAYAAKGEKKKAIKMFKKSNTLNPRKQVRDSNDTFIKQLQK